MPSLSVLIGITTAVTVLVVASITLSVTLTYSFDALRNVGEKHAQALLDAATYRVFDFMEEANGAALTVQQHFVSGKHAFATEDPTPVTLLAQASMMLATFRASRHLYSVVMFGVDGSFTPVIVNPKDAAHVLQENNIARGSTVIPYTQSWWASNGTASPTYLSTGFNPLDSRVLFQPGVSLAVVRDIVGNSSMNAFVVGMSLSVYVNGGITLQVLQIPIARNVWNASGTYMGIVWGTVSTQWFTLFLQGVKSTPGSQLFVLDPSQAILGTTYPANISTMTIVPPGTVPPARCLTTEATSTVLFGGPVFMSCFESLTTYPWAPVRQLSAAGLPAYNSIVYNQLAGASYFVARSQIVPTDSFGYHLELLVLLPETDVLGNVYEGRDVAIGVAVAVFVVGTVVSVGVVVMLLSPLSGIAERMHKAATFEDNDTTRHVSRVTEVGQLQASYYELNDELRRLSAYVPASVLANKYADADLEADEAMRTGPTSAPVAAAADGAIPSSDSVYSRSSRRSAASKRSSAAGNLNVSLGLLERPCTVLVANCRDFHGFVRGKSTSGIVAAYSAFMDGVVTVVNANHGVLDHFHGDQLLVSFNGARQIGMHTRRAANTAFALTSAMHGALGLGVHIGVCSGRALLGNVGGDTSRRFSILGSVVTRAAYLARAGATYVTVPPLRRSVETAKKSSGATTTLPTGCIVLIPATTVVDLSNFRTEPLDLVCLPQRDKFEVLQRLVSPIDETQGEEWLYVVGHTGDKAEGGGGDAALETLIERAYHEAAREQWDVAASTCAAAQRAAEASALASPHLDRLVTALALRVAA